MYKLCKSEQSAERQRALERGLLEMMQSVPYDQISITDLCVRLQIPRKAFYRYFTDKEGALYALIDHTMIEYEQFSAAKNRGKRTLTGDLEQYFLFWQAQKPLLDALARSGVSQMLVNRVVEQMMQGGGIPGRFMKKESATMQPHVIQFALTGMMTTMLRWHQSGFATPADELAAIMARLLTQPLFSPAELA